MFKKIVVVLVVLALMAGVFAPLVQHTSQALAAEKPAAVETAWVAYPLDGKTDPAGTFSPMKASVGWNG
jgi:hypothetical protein